MFKIQNMTGATEIKNINDFVKNFLGDRDSSLVDVWSSMENQRQLSSIMPNSTKTKTTKDPDKPKKAKTAYLFFCNENRSKIKEKLGTESKTTEIIAALGLAWNELKENNNAADKKNLTRYSKMATDDSLRYKTEMESYKPTDKADNNKIIPFKSNDSKNKKPKKNGFVYFCQQNREKLKNDNEELKGVDITKKLSTMWKNLTELEQNKWKEDANNE